MQPFWQYTVYLILALSGVSYLLIDKWISRTAIRVGKGDVIFLLWFLLLCLSGYKNPPLFIQSGCLLFTAWSISKYNNVRCVWWLLGGICFVCMCSAMVQLLKIGNTTRLYGWIGNPGIFANMLLPFVGLLLSVVFFARRKWNKYVSLLFFLVIALFIALTQSRATWLGAVVSFIFLLFVYSAVGRFLKKLSKIQTFGLVTFLLLAIVFTVFQLYRMRQEPVDGRKLIYTVSAHAVLGKPQGRGLGSFSVDYTQLQGKYFEQYPDSKRAILADDAKFAFNDLLQVGFEIGWIGLLLFVVSLLFLMRVPVPNEHRMEVLGLKAVLLGFFAASLFSYPLYQWIPSIEICLLAGLLLSYNQRSFIKVRIPSKVLIALLLLMVVPITLTICDRWNGYNNYRRWDEVRKMESTEQNEKILVGNYNRLIQDMPYNGLLKYHYGITLFELKRYNESIAMLKQASEQYSELNLWMCLAENYRAIGVFEKATTYFWKAYYMAPKRFMPLYKLMLVYKEMGDMSSARLCAEQILNKTIKIPSPIVDGIKREARLFLQPQ